MKLLKMMIENDNLNFLILINYFINKILKIKLRKMSDDYSCE
jgi:hypothetical protein